MRPAGAGINNQAGRLPPARRLPQQLRKLGNVGSDGPGFVPGEQVRRRPSPRLVLEIEIAERLCPLLLRTIKQASFASLVVPIGGKRRAPVSLATLSAPDARAASVVVPTTLAHSVPACRVGSQQRRRRRKCLGGLVPQWRSGPHGRRQGQH